LPSTGESIKYIPLLVKEEKVLLTALESFNQKSETEDLSNAIMQVVNNCIVSQNIDIEKLANLDIEYLFLNIRKVSVGETVNVIVTHSCGNGIGHENKIVVNLNDTKVVIPEGHSPIIMLDDTIGVKMKYPSLKESMKVVGKKNKSKVDMMYETIATNIDIVVNGDDMIDISDVSVEELKQWLETFPTNVMEKIYTFFETLPHLQTKINYTCLGCGQAAEVEVNGTSDFFI